MELNERGGTISVKIVYYGPALGGKTTNLAKLHQNARAARRGDLISVNSAQDRTILFDLLPLKTLGFRGFDTSIRLVAVPGQPIYAGSRRVALKAVDGVVFVANSAVDRWDENIQSYKEMLRNIVVANYQIDPKTMPFVLQYNKRDLPEVMPVESLDHVLNMRRLDPVLAVATRGEGVLETFAAILLATMQDVVKHHKVLAFAGGQNLEDWVAEAIENIFGTTALTAAPAVPPPTAPDRQGIGPSADEEGGAGPIPAPGHRKIRIAMSDDAPAVSPSGPTREMQEALIESYAEASAELGEVTAWLRQERDSMRSRNEDVRRTLDVGDAIGHGMDVVAGLVRALGVLGDAGGTLHVAFALPAPVGSFRAVLHPPLVEDPLTKSPHGLARLEAFRRSDRPVLLRTSDVPDLDAVLGAGEPHFVAVVVVPFQGIDRPLGFAHLYYTLDKALPSADTLAHLGLLARILRTPLELAVARGAL